VRKNCGGNTLGSMGLLSDNDGQIGDDELGPKPLEQRTPPLDVASLSSPNPSPRSTSVVHVCSDIHIHIPLHHQSSSSTMPIINNIVVVVFWFDALFIVVVGQTYHMGFLGRVASMGIFYLYSIMSPSFFFCEQTQFLGVYKSKPTSLNPLVYLQKPSFLSLIVYICDLFLFQMCSVVHMMFVRTWSYCLQVMQMQTIMGFLLFTFHLSSRFVWILLECVLGH
jgi:hypothetical protein